MFVLDYIIAFFIFTFIGNGFLSLVLKTKKTIQFSTLENVIISFGLGVNFVIIYFYAIDIFGTSNFFLLVPMPILIGFILKLLSIPTKIRWNREALEEIKTYFKQKYQKIKNILNKKANSKSIISKNTRNVKSITLIVILVAISLVIYIVFWVFASNFSQFALDPNSWVNVIVKFRSDPYIDYPTLSAYPAGFVIFSGFILFLNPDTGFVNQFLFLKWLPFLNLILCLVILYPIQKRLFKNKNIFYVIVILLISQQYFLYRTMMLVPSILLTTQLEILLLMLVIDGFPRPLIYFSLSSLLLIHTANAVFILLLYFGYLIFNKLLPHLRRRKRIEKDPAEGETKTDDLSDKLRFQNSFKNLIAFLIPFAIYALNLTICYSPTWYTSFLFYLKSGSLLNSVLSILASILSSIGDFFWEFAERTGWVTIWGGILGLGVVFYVILIIGVFFKFKHVEKNTPKSKFIKFAKFSVIVTLVFHFLPIILYLLEPINNSPIILPIYNLLGSSFYNNYIERIFEVVGPINAIFGAIIFEEIYHRFSIKQNQNRTQMNNTSKNGKYRCSMGKKFLGITIGCLLVINFFSQPYYEYNYSTYYVEGVVSFRQYLDMNGIPGEMIGYCENNSEVRDLLIYYATPRFTIIPINCTINSTIARTHYLENISCSLNYLVVSRNDDNNWNDLLSYFSSSNNIIFVGERLIILKK
ncbi:MAG: hypothetical protein A2V66_15790 [Ignavibacteria bacterium RBG_13_36_8]|nr:MAG: hypothetical protein A2V66_15790 [Ignavibacteria bacterium RBG_13_36_8]